MKVIGRRVPRPSQDLGISVWPWLQGVKVDPSASYRQARAWLESMRLTGRILDTCDGVEMWLDRHSSLLKAGVAVTRGIRIGFHGRREDFAFLVRSAGGRTYHADRWITDPREAFRQALAAWRLQDELLVKEADLVSFLRGDEGICPLITRQTSYSAGNCSPGTEAWLRQTGWTNRNWIPAVWLIPHLEDERVRRVAAALKREFTSV